MTDLDPLGTVLREDARIGVRYERRLAHAPEKVWAAITESDHLRHWLPCDIIGERREGAVLTLPFWPDHVEAYDLDEVSVLRGEINAWRPPELFEWTWDQDLLRFELFPIETGTRLIFTTWINDTTDYSPTQTAAGYHVCLAELRALLDTGTSTPLIDVDPTPWEHAYGQVFAVSS